MFRPLLIVIACFCLNSWVRADAFKCEVGGQRAVNDYQTAINLLREGRRLSSIEEMHVLALLEKSVKSKCSMAAIALVEIKANQLAANQGKDKKLSERLDDEIYSLLLEATKLNEGWFEFGYYLLDSHSRHYDPARGREILEKAGEDGDRRAMDFLMGSYKMGADGFPVDQQRAKYWERKLEEK